MIKNVICPDKNTCALEQCLKSCRMESRCVPYTYAIVASRQRKWSGIPSVTQLLNGTREAFLKITCDYDVDLRDHAFMLLGTSAHKLLEETETNYVIAREKTVELEGISGTFDLLERWGDKVVLIDHKTSGSYMVMKMLGLVEVKVPQIREDGSPVMYNSKPKYDKKIIVDKNAVDKFEYQMQLNFYRIAIEKAAIVDNVDEMYNFVIVRDGGTYVATNRGVSDKVYLIKQDKLSDDFVLSYFTHKRDALLTALRNNELPPICDERENWGFRKCENYCPVSNYCDYKKYMGGDI